MASFGWKLALLSAKLLLHGFLLLDLRLPAVKDVDAPLGTSLVDFSEVQEEWLEAEADVRRRGAEVCVLPKLFLLLQIASSDGLGVRFCLLKCVKAGELPRSSV